jgi:hypothetical protein
MRVRGREKNGDGRRGLGLGLRNRVPAQPEPGAVERRDNDGEMAKTTANSGQDWSEPARCVGARDLLTGATEPEIYSQETEGKTRSRRRKRVRPCGSPLAGRNGGGGQAEAQSLAVAERRREPGDGGREGMGARVTGGGSRGRAE